MRIPTWSLGAQRSSLCKSFSPNFSCSLPVPIPPLLVGKSLSCGIPGSWQFPDGRFSSGLGKSRASCGLSEPAPSLDGAFLHGPPIPALCSPRRSPPAQPISPALRGSAASAAAPRHQARLGARVGAGRDAGTRQQYGRWGPLSLEPPTSPGPCGLPTGCRRTGRSCLLPPLVPPPSPLPSLSPTPSPRSSSLPPPPRLPTTIPFPGPQPRLGPLPG